MNLQTFCNKFVAILQCILQHFLQQLLQFATLLLQICNTLLQLQKPNKKSCNKVATVDDLTTNSLRSL